MWGREQSIEVVDIRLLNNLHQQLSLRREAIGAFAFRKPQLDLASNLGLDLGFLVRQWQAIDTHLLSRAKATLKQHVVTASASIRASSS
ncbi:hypothetical protein PGT21_030214 [Puccinia graminis f. sp. tritici]|uniref:Uncharacterized protein n=1 Tax=Puccinia graminis f. sp. tritici TaxID=56615 RepID=A0A5B0MM85_PUCGR|nr:hypothetical protein PGT21_030214 [Puccinia graminis f. sp. tritici]